MPTLASEPRDASGRQSIVTEIEFSTSKQLWLFAITLFGSALLLFAVQPMFAKMALPKLGGSPSVWAVSMCFFQAMLLAGYAYAHALNRYLAPSAAVLAHMVLLVVTLFALPISLPSALGEPPQGDAYLWLIGVLALGVGLPFFAVSANAPLLQAWFARTGHPAARDPYFLYGASNIGSLLALIAYPTIIEPLAGAQAQARTWSFGFMLLAVLIALCGMIMISLQARVHAAVASDGNTDATTTDAALPSSRDRSLWVLLAAIPSGLMVAVTTVMTTDIASAPFLWVIPLALFLLTFVMVFKERVWKRFALLSALLPMLAVAGAVNSSYRMPFAVSAFFAAALVCHRELYLRRPASRHLTAFYLWMSFGGVLGGVFAALIAPQIFISSAEYQILLIAALFCAPGILFGTPIPLDAKRIAGLACLALACFCIWSIAGDLGGVSSQSTASFVIVCGILVALLLTRDWPEQRVNFMIAVGLVMLTLPQGFRAVYAERSFFGTVRVMETGDGQHRLMLHGTTMHGKRRIKTSSGEPVTTPVPASYYHRLTPMGRGFEVARKSKAEVSNGSTRLLTGIVGLGTGSLACYVQPGDAFRFFEIDPVVVKVATNPKLFDFMSTCAPRAPIIVGDARLMLAKEPDEVFDYLVIDAFSSDSVPVHLLTREAINLYLSKLAPHGLLALHISNRYMDLPSVVSSTIADIPGMQAALVRFTAPEGEVDASASHVVMITRTSKVLDEVQAWSDAQGLPRSTARAWTDDYSNVVAAIWRMLTK